MPSVVERIAKLEAFQTTTEGITIPSILVSVKDEIPAHYTKRINESEERVKMSIAQIIDEKLDKRFGWWSKLWQAVLQAVIIAAMLYWVGLA